MKLYLVCVLAVLFIACSSVKSSTQADVSYMDTAKQNFEAGEKLLKAHKYEDAIAYFEYVKSKFPYSPHAAMSDLRIADTYFDDEKWMDAAESYELFMRYHPRHQEVAYANYRACLAYYNAIPDDWFFPSSEKRDQKATREVLNSVNRFLEQFPDDVRTSEVLNLKQKVLEKLAYHDFLVGQYYAKQKRWKGAFCRFESILANFPNTKAALNAALQAADIAKLHLDDNEKAQELWNKVIELAPDSEQAKLAKKNLGNP